MYYVILKLGNINFKVNLKQEKINVDELHNPAKYAVAKEEFRDITPKAGDFKGDVQVSFFLKILYINF